MATNEEPYPNADPALSYDSARFQLTAQLSSIDSINQSYALLISLATALIAIIVAAFGIRAGQPGTDIRPVAYWLVGTAAAIYLGSPRIPLVGVSDKVLQDGTHWRGSLAVGGGVS